MALTGLAFSLAALAAPSATAQTAPVVAYSVRTSARVAGVSFQLANGRSVEISLRGGDVMIDGARVAGYEPGGALEEEWRRFLNWAGSAGADGAVAAARAWTPERVSGSETQALDLIRQQFAGLQASAIVPPPPPVAEAPDAPGVPDVPELAAARESREAARALREQIRSSVRSSIRDGIRIGNIDTRRSRFTTPVGGVAGGLLALAGAFLALSAIAFGTSFFAGRQLDVVADTVSTSLARSFFVGLFAQPLVLPALGALVAGLTLTVIGILVIPVAIVAFFLTLAAALIGGYLAMARVAGSAWMKRKKGDQGVDGFGTLRSVAYGLAILLAVWLPAILLGWTPVAGPILTWTAAVGTWAMITTGFGAAILTRGGVRTTFGRRFTAPTLPPAALYEQAGPEISTSEWLAGNR